MLVIVRWNKEKSSGKNQDIPISKVFIWFLANNYCSFSDYCFLDLFLLLIIKNIRINHCAGCSGDFYKNSRFMIQPTIII